MLFTPIYAAILGLGFVRLSFLTLRLRRQNKIALGDGGNPQLLRAIRVHSNFAEYVPIALILIYMTESIGAPIYLIHFLGICLIIGRLSHAWGVSQENENFKFRVFGMIATFNAIIVSSLYILVSQFI
ncbi:MAG: MAPEG family protein [Methylococcaceae bacterium]